MKFGRNSTTEKSVALVGNVSQTDYNQLGYALMFKCFQREGKFPQRKLDTPPVITEQIAQQLHVSVTALNFYNWTGRTAKRYRVYIRQSFGFRIGTLADAANITAWLAAQTLLGEDRQFDRLKEAVYERYRDLKIEPPEPKSIERLIRSAVRAADEQFYATTMEKLSTETRKRLDALLELTVLADGATGNTSLLQQLRSEAGASTLDSVLEELEKLKQLRLLGLPADPFSHTPRKVVSWYRSRVAVEDLSEIRRHPNHIRYTLLSAYCSQREQEIIDTLLDLLINLIHRIEKRAVQTVNKELLQDAKRIGGKHKLLYEVAQASLEKPDGTVKDVIYPVVGEKTLHDLVEEFKSGGSYEQKVQVLMRGS